MTRVYHAVDHAWKRSGRSPVYFRNPAYQHPDNVWNKTLAELHSDNIPIHANSAAFMDRVLDGKGSTPQRNYLGSDVTQSTLPVYEINNSTPVSNWLRVSDSWRYGNDASMDGTYQVNQGVAVPIPTGIVKPPGYSDYQVILYNTDTGEEWNIWHAGLNMEQTAFDGLDANGIWVPIDVGGGVMRYTCQSAGLYSPVGSDGAPGTGGFLNGLALPAKTPKAWGARGAKVPLGVGLVRKWEIDEGVIRHAIAWAYHGPSPDYVYPAQNSDGSNFGGVSGVDIPEGARIRLDPNFDLTQFPAGAARVVGKALQDYGAILIDNSGFPKVYLESQNTAPWGTDVTASMLSAAPLSAYQVVDWSV